MVKVAIKPGHEKNIAESVNDLIGGSDKDRKDFLKLLLTIYTPVASGLFFLSTKPLQLTGLEKLAFLIVSTSAVLIVLLTLLIFFTYFLSSTKVAKNYLEEVSKTGEHYNKQLLGKKWHSWFIRCGTLIIASLLILNLLGVLLFVYGKVL